MVASVAGGESSVLASAAGGHWLIAPLTGNHRYSSSVRIHRWSVFGHLSQPCSLLATVCRRCPSPWADELRLRYCYGLANAECYPSGRCAIRGVPGW